MATEAYAYGDEQTLRDSIKATGITLGTRKEVAKPRGPKDEGGGGCDQQNTIWDITLINATGGDYDLPVTVNGVTEIKTFDWDMSSADFATELATHSEIATTANIDVTGQHPKITMRVEFIGDLANTYILHPPVDATNLTGYAVIIAQAQRGHG